ncbi:NAD(P)-binding protein [Methyloceanibacter sp.]|uniref:NAD(P)-binding protein n=1 Tax=Methyloceanibacter sp. TaxID=1965321 RepID=UPI003D6D9A2C
MEKQCVIVGAGPAGLTAAYELSETGAMFRGDNEEITTLIRQFHHPRLGPPASGQRRDTVC